MYDEILQVCEEVAEKSKCNHIMIYGNVTAIGLLRLSIPMDKFVYKNIIIELVTSTHLDENMSVYILPSFTDKLLQINYYDELEDNNNEEEFIRTGLYFRP